jgi:hypothetical protein
MGPLGRTPIPRKQVEAELQMYQAKVELQKTMLNAHMQRAIKERALVTFLVESQEFGAKRPVALSVLKNWQEAQIAEMKAKEDMLRVTLVELTSQVQILQAMLEQSDKKIAVPSGPVF